MYEISRSIQCPGLKQQTIFNLVTSSLQGLITDWELEDCNVKEDRDSNSIELKANKFSATIKVIDNELEFSGKVEKLFNFGKKEIEEKLNNWLADIFDSNYEI